MEDEKTRKSTPSAEQLVVLMNRLGEERAMHRQALKDVSDELALVARRASAMGVSDAGVARAARVAVTTVRIWLGKRNDSKRDS